MALSSEHFKLNFLMRQICVISEYLCAIKRISAKPSRNCDYLGDSNHQDYYSENKIQNQNEAFTHRHRDKQWTHYNEVYSAFMVFRHHNGAKQSNEVVSVVFLTLCVYQCVQSLSFSVERMVCTESLLTGFIRLRWCTSKTIHIMKYGNLVETNFICVITKLSYIPCELSPSSIFIQTLFLVDCIGKPRITYSVSFIRFSFHPLLLRSALLQHLRHDKIALAPDFNGCNVSASANQKNTDHRY